MHQSNEQYEPNNEFDKESVISKTESMVLFDGDSTLLRAKQFLNTKRKAKKNKQKTSSKYNQSYEPYTSNPATVNIISDIHTSLITNKNSIQSLESNAHALQNSIVESQSNLMEIQEVIDQINVATRNADQRLNERITENNKIISNVLNEMDDIDSRLKAFEGNKNSVKHNIKTNIYTKNEKHTILKKMEEQNNITSGIYEILNDMKMEIQKISAQTLQSKKEIKNLSEDVDEINKKLRRYKKET
eukprot:350128_1